MPSLTVSASQFGEIHYNDTLIDYSKIDKNKTLYFADFYFNKALKEKNNDEKLGYLQKASGMYFLLSQIDSGDLYPIVQMARVYDYENQNSYAKAYFYKALKIERYNAATNYYFGEYYYSRDDYRRALYFYNTAFENGYRENYDVLLKMAIMYEKLGDLLRANQYYKKAYLVKPDSKELPDKIRELESIKYKNTGYYNSLKRK
jgi:tetratricopeptide (TPR) repeat protein